MKMKPSFAVAALTVFVGACLFPSAATPHAGPLPEAPVIAQVMVADDDLVLTVAVPPGCRRVVLESRAQPVGGAWVPRAVEWTDGEGGVVTFQLPHARQAEIFRVRGDENGELPASFYAGPTEFAGGDDTGFWRYGPIDAIGAPEGGGASDADTNREVQESDIWQLRGNRLYFFNQLRGLQVLDVTDPDHPVVTARLALPAVGEQMYVLDDTHVVLLARSGCAWPSLSEVLVVKVAGDTAVVESALPVEGGIQESRMVGSALYVVAQTYRESVRAGDGGADAERVWEWGSLAVSFDLADPENPAPAGSLWFAGQGNVVSANDQWLLVVTQETGDWWQSLIRLVDISDPAGAMAPRGWVRPAGRVADKFKMNLDGEVLAVVSEDLNRDTGGLRASVLQTFSLATPDAPERLGAVAVGHGEALFATRFDGDRAYIVTFERVDPLWVVDLSDPRNPRVAGELEIPGWSTYIHPLGDRLVTVGVDNTEGWKVAVQLFDVQDPARPALLSKVPLGENYSWSEANYDEKALKVLPDEGLILVPYQGWTGEGQANRLQLVDWQGDELVARGVIEHSLSARRATSHAGRILSVSGREFVVVDAADRDAPEVTARLDLAWAVDRLVVVGEHVVQVSDGTDWGATAGAALRVSSRDAPDEVLATVYPANPWPVVGLEVSGDRLFLLQADYNGFWAVPEDGAGGAGEAEPANVALTVYALDALPDVVEMGRAEARVEGVSYSSQMEALWTGSGLLVWSEEGGGYWRGWIDAPMIDVAIAPGRWWPWWGGGGRLWVFDVTDPGLPVLRSTLDLAQNGERWGFSRAQVASGLVYRSSQQSEFIPFEPDADPSDGEPVKGRYEVRHFLHVVDLTDPDLPTVREPVNIPGQLRGLSHAGALLYTVGPHYDKEGLTDWVNHLDASAYEGTKAALVASLPLREIWPEPVRLGDGWLLQRPPTADNGEALLEVWGLTGEGRFAMSGSLALSARVNEWVPVGDGVIARRSGYLELFGVVSRAPVRLKSAGVSDCQWFNLERAVVADAVWLPLGDYGVGRAAWLP